MDSSGLSAYRPIRWLAGWLIGAIVLSLLLRITVAGLDVLVLMRFVQLPDASAVAPPAGAVAFVLARLLAGVAYMICAVATTVLFCVWVHRANSNAWALGTPGMEFTPGWAVGWFFVPVANLFKPFQVIREIYLASGPEIEDDAEEEILLTVARPWLSRPVPRQVPIWWGTWILMNVLDNFAFRASLGDTPSETALWPVMGAIAASIPCSLLLIWIVLEIRERQNQRSARRSPAVRAGERE